MYQYLVICFVVLIKKCSSNTEFEAVDVSFSSYAAEGGERELPPVIILHGLLGSKRNWNSIAQSLAEKTDREVYCLDARNHGDSPHSSKFTYNHLVVDVVEFMKKQGIQNATIIGHSLGGKTAMLFSMLYPELVEGLIVVDISPMGISPGFGDIPGFVKAMIEVDLEKLSGMILSEARNEAKKQLQKDITDPMIVQFLLTNLVQDSEGNYKWKINLNIINESLEHIGRFICDIGKVFKGPTLFIGGGNSDYIKEKNHKLIKKMYPASEIKYIPGAGHWVHADKPNDFLDLAVGFLNNIGKS